LFKHAHDVLTQAIFYQNKTSLQYPLYDHITMQQIMGLNFYSKLVEFHVPNDEVYCDRSTSNNRTLLLTTEAGLHSPDPTFRQAFHFGLHRGLKGQQQKYEASITNAYRSGHDDRRLMALCGFAASKAFTSNKKTSYSDDEFSDAYVDACVNFAKFKAKILSKK